MDNTPMPAGSADRQASPGWTYWVPTQANPPLALGWIRRESAKHGEEFEVKLWWLDSVLPMFGPDTQQTLVIAGRLSSLQAWLPFSVSQPNEPHPFLAGVLSWRGPPLQNAAQLWIEQLRYPGGRVEEAWIA